MAFDLPNIKLGFELEVVDNGNTPYQFENSKWSQKYDGSLPGGGREYVTTPIKGDDAIYQVKSMTDALNRNARISDECGYHIHLDFSNARFTEIKRFYRFCRQVFPFIRPSFENRLSGQWCKPFPNDYNRILTESTHLYSMLSRMGDRYIWMNFTAWYRHGTIENRLHHGTKDYNEIMSWAEFWAKAAYFCQKNALPKRIPRRYNSDFVEEAIDAIELSPVTKDRFGNSHKLYMDNLRKLAKQNDKNKK